MLFSPRTRSARRSVLLTIILLAFAPLAAGDDPIDVAAAHYDQPGPHAIRTLEFPQLKDSKRANRIVPMKVHFPVAGSGFPLVIMSHGGGGNWDGLLYQAQHLASHGYVVVCLEHIDSSARRVRYYMSRQGGGMSFRAAIHRITKDASAVLERPRDVRFGIDTAIAWNRDHPELAGRIDTRRIGVMGHSYGAYTTLVAVGAQPILDHLVPRTGAGRGLAGDLSDPRVTFGFAMSPQAPRAVFFGNDSYRTVNRPLICVTGSKDELKGIDGTLVPAEARREVFTLLPPGQKYFVWLENADHFSFADNPKSYLFPSRARRDTARIVKALMVVASDHFLKEKPEAGAFLTAAYANSLRGRVVTAIEWLEK